MDPNDRAAIDDLFNRLNETARTAPQPEPEADDLIHRRLRESPSAAYHLAQTVVAQRQALEAAQDRIDELEGRPGYSRQRAAGQGAQQPQQQEGGFFSRIFGAAPGERPRTAVPTTPGYGRPDPYAGRRGGGGFLAGAAQTAVGVAGGVIAGSLIMNAIGGLGGEAQAAEPQTAADTNAGNDAGADEGGGDWGGDDMGGDAFDF